MAILDNPDAFDTAVKLHIYDTIATSAVIPSTADVAAALRVSNAEIEFSFDRLHKKRLIVPEPGDHSRIRMAPPFSGINTPFKVIVEHRNYYANCIWDAFGIAAALKQVAVVETFDAHDDSPIAIQIDPNGPREKSYVAHFAVPAAKWWADIVYT